MRQDWSDNNLFYLFLQNNYYCIHQEDVATSGMFVVSGGKTRSVVVEFVLSTFEAVISSQPWRVASWSCVTSVCLLLVRAACFTFTRFLFNCKIYKTTLAKYFNLKLFFTLQMYVYEVSWLQNFCCSTI